MCFTYHSHARLWVQLAPGVPAVPEYYDRKQFWPAASLERRTQLLARIAGPSKEA